MEGRWRVLILIALGCCGCNQNPLAPGARTSLWGQPQEQPAYVAQLQDLDQRNRKLDANNNDLHQQLARSQQQLQLLRDEVQLLRRQLNDTANQLEATQLAKQEAEKRVEAIQTSVRQRGGASISANNSLTQPLKTVEIPGLEVRRDGDVLRIEIPADQLFEPGTVRWQANASRILDQVAQTISTNFPRQIIGIEAHTDSSTLREASNFHQLSASQALAVFQHFTQRNGLPERQLFTIAHGANQPIVSNGTPAGRAKNRRVEVVVYPDTM